MNKWIIVLSILFSAQMTSAEIFKWTDEQGNIHYSDSRPAQESEKPAVDLESIYEPPIKSNKSKTLRESINEHTKCIEEQDIMGKDCYLSRKEGWRLYRVEAHEIETKIKQAYKERQEASRELDIIRKYDGYDGKTDRYKMFRRKEGSAQRRLNELSRQKDALARKYGVSLNGHR